MLRQLALVPLLGIAIVALILLLAPGWWLAGRLRPNWCAAERTAVAVVVAALAGYLAFWAYLYSPDVGRVCSWIFAGFSVATIADLVWRRRFARLECLTPVLLTLCASVLAIGLLNLVQIDGTQPDVAARRFFGLATPDNVIPMLFADRLFRGVDPHNNPADRAWIPIQVDLGRYAGRSMQIIFNADARMNPLGDSAVWGDPGIIARQAE